MIGLSVSRCIRDMVSDTVDSANVSKIIGRTRASTPEEIDRVVRIYRDSYWSDQPDAAEQLFREMLAAGKIEQPRIASGRMPSIGGTGHWVEHEEQIMWMNYH